jgi:uncharacterized membrane protein
VLAAAALYLAVRWDAIPPVWIVHWDAAGRPNGLAHRTVTGVFELPVAGAIVVGFVEGLAALARSKGAALAALTDASSYAVRAVSFGLAVLFAFLAVDLPLGPPMSIGMRLAVPLAILGAALVVGGRGIARALGEVRRAGHGAKVEGYHAFHYANRNDSRLWVPKLSGLGWTLNFSNPWAWPMLLLLVGVPIAVAVLGALAPH